MRERSKGLASWGERERESKMKKAKENETRIREKFVLNTAKG